MYFEMKENVTHGIIKFPEIGKAIFWGILISMTY